MLSIDHYLVVSCIRWQGRLGREDWAGNFCGRGMLMDHVQDLHYRSCGLKVVGTCHGVTGGPTGGDQQKNAFKQKKESVQVWFSRGSPEAADRY